MSLKSALLRLNKHREERNHFDEASNLIIVHLKSKVQHFRLSQFFTLSFIRKHSSSISRQAEMFYLISLYPIGERALKIYAFI